MRGLPKKYAKMGFKKGWAAYRRTHGKRKTVTHHSSSSKTKRRKRTVAKRKSRSRRKMFGTLGWQGLAIGIAGVTAVKYLIRRFLPQAGAYSNGLGMLGVGLWKKSLLAPSLVELGSEAVTDLFTGGGIYTLPTFGRATANYDL